jgi:hypothetical protein
MGCVHLVSWQAGEAAVAKLGDFGLSCKTGGGLEGGDGGDGGGGDSEGGGSEQTRGVGTGMYASPELLNPAARCARKHARPNYRGAVRLAPRGKVRRDGE